jgi:hypothetical protein
LFTARCALFFSEIVKNESAFLIFSVNTLIFTEELIDKSRLDGKLFQNSVSGGVTYESSILTVGHLIPGVLGACSAGMLIVSEFSSQATTLLKSSGRPCSLLEKLPSI